MGMDFTLSVSADFTADIDADNLVSRYDVDSDMLGLSGDINLDVNEVSGSVHVEGSLSGDGIEVAASDMSGFDVEAYLRDAYGSSDLDLSNEDFEVTDSPTGFETVVDVTDRDTAIEVYAALANAGFEVS